MTSPLRTDDAVGFSKNIIDPDPERALGQVHEMFEEAEHFRMAAVIARQWAAAGNMPEDIWGEGGKRALNVAACKGVVSFFY